jgi:hypothetical protein
VDGINSDHISEAIQYRVWTVNTGANGR